MLELQLVKDGEVILRIPVISVREEMQELLLDIDDDDLDRLANIYSLVSNERRLRVMLELVRKGEMRFSDVLRIVTNPKLVQDCLEPMVKNGLIIHEGRGSCYRPSIRGMALALAMTTGLAKIIELIEEEIDEYR